MNILELKILLAKFVNIFTYKPYKTRYSEVLHSKDLETHLKERKEKKLN